MVEIIGYFFGTGIALYTGKRQQLTGGKTMNFDQFITENPNVKIEVQENTDHSVGKYNKEERS